MTGYRCMYPRNRRKYLQVTKNGRHVRAAVFFVCWCGLDNGVETHIELAVFIHEIVIGVDGLDLPGVHHVRAGLD